MTRPRTRCSHSMPITPTVRIRVGLSHCDLGCSGVPFSAWGRSEFPNAVERFRHSVPVEGVASKAVEMPGQVWAGASDEVRVQCIPLCDQPFQCVADGHNVVEDQEIGDEVVVFDELALLVANPFGGQRATAEGDPLEKLIETFALVGRGLDQPPQLNIGKVVEQKACTDSMTQFPKNEIKFTLSRVGCQPAEDG